MSKCYLCGSEDSDKWFRIKLPSSSHNIKIDSLYPYFDVSNYHLICKKCVMLSKLEDDENSLNIKIKNKYLRKAYGGS
jgi:hypothetical protein